ncbi:ketopantoate reductase PanE/ApbA-domain-containing protein [Aspergillus oleicola]
MTDASRPNPVRVLVFGMGSIGIVYSMILSRSGVDLSCVCRSNYTAAKTNGFIVYSTIFGTETFRPAAIYSSVEEIIEKREKNETAPYDFILVTTKAFPRNISTEDASIAASIAPLVFSSCTTVVLIQNGIGIEQPYRDHFPQNPIISCVAYLPTTQTAPGVVHHTEEERLHLGAFPVSNEKEGTDGIPPFHHEAVATLAARIRAGGATAEIYRDVQVARWRKLIGNASWNPICALSRCRDLEFLQASTLASGMAQNVLEEVLSVAVAAGYGAEIGPEDVKMQLSRSAARSWPGVEPSMLADARSGKVMEAEAVVGEVVRMGRRYKVAIPGLNACTPSSPVFVGVEVGKTSQQGAT